MGLTVAAACGGSSTATTSPSPAVFDDHFGVLIGNTVRAESGPQSLFVLGIDKDTGGVVSPDGRRLAYWAGSELRVIDVARDAQYRTLLAIPSDEAALYFAWSNDGTGIVIGVNGGGGGQGDAPPGYTALRAVDVAGGTAREIARIKNANVVPLAWDRQARVIAAYEPIASGTYNYDLVSESGTVKRTPPASSLYFLEASHDAQQVFGHVDLATSALRVWPAATFERSVDLKVPAGQNILGAHWRPGTAEIGVLFTDRLELWNAAGASRSLALPAAPPSSDRYTSLVFRADGKVAFVGRQIESSPGTFETYTVAVDLASGRNVVVRWPGGAAEPGRSVRISS
jgi:hypothetical protein